MNNPAIKPVNPNETRFSENGSTVLVWFYWHMLKQNAKSKNWISLDQGADCDIFKFYLSSLCSGIEVLSEERK